MLLTAAFVYLSLLHLLGSCISCKPLHAVPLYTLLDHNEFYERFQLDPGDESSLIDLRNFSFLINGPVCNSSSPLYVALVHSSPDHEAHRRAIRSTWGHSAHLVFLVGESNSTVVQDALDRENYVHHDLVQGSFFDSYRNLTYKHVMGLKWITYHCTGARYVLKVDDDIFVNTPFLEEFLRRELSPAGTHLHIMCNLFANGEVIRYPSKWQVTLREYAGSNYPDYCSGWAILYPADAVVQLYREAQRTDYFWIDDVHVTGTVREKTNYTITNIGELLIGADTVLKMADKGHLENFLFSAIASVDYFYKMWDIVNSSHPVTLLPAS